MSKFVKKVAKNNKPSAFDNAARAFSRGETLHMHDKLISDGWHVEHLGTDCVQYKKGTKTFTQLFVL